MILKDLLNKREFTNEGTIEQRAKKYEEHSDPIEKFLKEFTEEDYNGYIWKFEFEKRLNEWLEEHRFRKMSEETVGKKMREKGIIQELRTSNWLTDGNYKRFRAWIGIKWKIEQPERVEQVVSTQYSHMETEYGLPVQLVQPVQ